MHSTLVEMIIQNLMSLLPWVIVRSYEEGVRWTLGKNPKAMKPGPHWKIWGIHQVDIYALVDDVVDLPVQSVITKDGKLVCFSVNIGYRIVDVVCHACNVQDFVESTAGLAMTHNAQRVRELTWDDLIAEGGLKKLEASLEGTLSTRMKRWGTQVFSVGFTNFALVPRQMRIFLDSHRNVHSLAAKQAKEI
jgi:regulator of protease activity HflC (stomatin/prohibitin superfamily)